ncbi:hypothetical protein NPIL_368851 [Nephila pilipes]|uniref:Uncharacterized protein n=1 Tax=Nephila pilipes TaxID=299642 RepID=A0A8X6NU83_NEPPI|nr:hypothetical protein NPIL_368851 [Nephila pilipes]
MRKYKQSFPHATSFAAADKSWSMLRGSHCVPDSLFAAAVTMFRLLTRHYCLSAYSFHFNIINSPIRVLYHCGQIMTDAHLDECSLNHLNCIVKKYWRARCLMA